MRYNNLAATALTTTLAFLVPNAASAQEQHDWSGFYVGGSFGVIKQDRSLTAEFPDSPVGSTGYYFNNNVLYLNSARQSGPLPTLFDLDLDGTSITVSSGYNFQAGQFVYGVEGDISLLQRSSTTSSVSTDDDKTDLTLSSRLHSLTTVRGRVGIAADRLLLFATAGIAGGATSLSTSLDYRDIGKSASSSGSSSGIALGVVAGLGAEYALNDNISLKAEGLYYALQGTSATATGAGDEEGTPKTFAPYSVSSQHSGGIIRAGVNFKF